MRVSVQSFPNRELRVIVGPDVAVRAQPSPPIGLVPSGAEGQSPPDQRESEVPLTLHPDSSGPRFTEAKSGFGRLGARTRFGTNGRRTILRCGGVFSACKVPPEEVLFLTGTLPGGTDDAKLAIARYSSWVVQALKKWLAEFVPDAWSLYVWELQKRGALHIHYAVWVPDEAARLHILRAFHGWWFRRMGLLSKVSGVDVFAWKSGRGSWRDRPDVVQADAQICEKCPSSYIAKYASKGAWREKVKSNHGDLGPAWPVQWWGVSRPLQRRCRELSFVTVVTDISRRRLEDIKERLERLVDESYERPHERGAFPDGEYLGPTHQYRSRCGKIQVTVAYGKHWGESEIWKVLALEPREREGRGGRPEGVRVVPLEGNAVEPKLCHGGDDAMGAGSGHSLADVGSNGIKESGGGARMAKAKGDAPGNEIAAIQLGLLSPGCWEPVQEGAGSVGRRKLSGGRRAKGKKDARGMLSSRAYRLIRPNWQALGVPHHRTLGPWFYLPSKLARPCIMGPRPHS
jgi:hypothetical protein